MATGSARYVRYILFAFFVSYPSTNVLRSRLVESLTAPSRAGNRDTLLRFQHGARSAIPQRWRFHEDHTT